MTEPAAKVQNSSMGQALSDESSGIPPSDYGSLLSFLAIRANYGCEWAISVVTRYRIIFIVTMYSNYDKRKFQYAAEYMLRQPLAARATGAVRSCPPYLDAR
eukprot:5807333-Pleurochrysis_carterae.AAC.2